MILGRKNGTRAVLSGKGLLSRLVSLSSLLRRLVTVMCVRRDD